MHIVEQIVEDLKSGKKDNEDFWIEMGDKYVFIRYFAVRNQKGEFLGVTKFILIARLSYHRREGIENW